MPTKLLVIGLDAADLDVLGPLLDRGELPHVGKLLRDGASGVLRSTVPPVSAPAWATFLTGVDPGRHGLYSFVVERGGGSTQLASLTDIRAPRIWDHVTRQGARPVIANVPVTWPPVAFDGVLVTGMLTPETAATQFTHPPELGAALRAAVPGYRIDIDRDLLEDRDGLFEALNEMTRRRRDLFVHLMRTEPWDVLVAAFTNTDRVQHSFWRHDRAKVDEHFRLVDGFVGDLLAEVDLSETRVLLMSDHGFQGARYKLYVNRLLADAGLLATHRAPGADEHYDRRRPDYFEGFQGGRGAPKHKGGLVKRALAAAGLSGDVAIDWAGTRAFLWSLDTGGVAVNLAGRYPHGCVAEADYESVRDEVIALLSSLTLPDGTRALRSVRRREEVYSGPYVDRAPDVVVEPDDALAFGMKLDAREALRGHKGEEGHHSPRGLIALAGPGIRRGATIGGAIRDCVPTMLHAMDLAVPEGLDGRVILEAFDDGREVRTIAAADDGRGPGEEPVYTSEEEEELRRSLEGLGYL